MYNCLIFRGRVGPNARLTASMHVNAHENRHTAGMSTHQHAAQLFDLTNARKLRPNKEKKKERKVSLFIYWAYVEKACSERPRQWKRKPEKKCRKRPGWGLTLTKFARCSRENSLTHASLTLMLSAAQLVPSRSDGPRSLQPWPAMRSTVSGSPIQLLLHLSSPFWAGFRVEVVDAEWDKANCPTVLGMQNFFHFQIETSPRSARQSRSYFINRQWRSF